MTDKEKQEIFNLVNQAKEGNQYSFTKLYNKFNKTIYSTLYYIVKNKDVADDLLSVTFTKAFKRLNSYVNNISFEMWLKTIATNTAIDYIRKTKKERDNLFIDDEESTIQLDSTADYSPEEILIYHETDKRLDEALSRLRWKYRNILLLRIAQNLSYKQISDKLGLSESQVKSLLNKAREKLRELLT